MKQKISLNSKNQKKTCFLCYAFCTVNIHHQILVTALNMQWRKASIFFFYLGFMIASECVCVWWAPSIIRNFQLLWSVSWYSLLKLFFSGCNSVLAKTLHILWLALLLFDFIILSWQLYNFHYNYCVHKSIITAHLLYGLHITLLPKCAW